jgi:superfamily I DNA/RNA helicase
MLKLKLNDEQLQAIAHPIGKPAIVLSGAGSGKTTVLTERVRWLMREKVPPLRICCITFTTKASETIFSRLGIEDTSFEDRPHVSTIHSLALGAIRKDPEGFGFTGHVTPMDDYDQAQAVKKIIERTSPILGMEKNPYRFLEKLGYHRARGVGFAVDYTDEVHEDALERHSGYHALEDWEKALWAQFEVDKQKSGNIDFDDMVHLVVRRGEQDESWRAALQRRFHHVLQDESHDTSPIQWRFINLLLAPDNLNLYAVGDLGQSIYGFQGAEPRLLKEFSEGWRGYIPDLYRITKNHRSLPNIIHLANKIQGTFTETIPLKMALFRGIDEMGKETIPGSTRLIRASTPGDVATIIAQEIRHDSQLKGTGNIAYKDNAILVRSAIQVRDLEGALVRFRIPYVVRGGKGLLQTEEIKDILSYFRLAVNPKDFTAFVRAIGTPKRGIGDVAIERLRKKADQEEEGDLIEACKGDKKLELFTYGMSTVVSRLSVPAAAVEEIVTSFNYKDYINAKYHKEPSKAKTKCENIDRFLLLVNNLVTDGLSAEDLVFQLALERPTDDEESGSVTISTIHSAKGLEWRRIYLTNMVEGSCPHRWCLNEESSIEEERRLWYVACTRAKDFLNICVHSLEPHGPNTISVRPSRFLSEIGIL